MNCSKLPPTERGLYDEDRLDHHARMLTVSPSFVEGTRICGRRLVLLNRHAISVRHGLMVSGLPDTGKTSAIAQLGRAHELLDRARHPKSGDRIPVLYITVRLLRPPVWSRQSSAGSWGCRSVPGRT